MVTQPPEHGGLDQAGHTGAAEPSEVARLEATQRTARELLREERFEALDSRSRATAWLLLFGFGPAALIAIVLAAVLGRADLILPFVGLGAGVQLWRMWRESRRIKRIEQELEDPMDGS